MPISAPGSFSFRRGFTLIELLVVLLLIGIAMSVASIGINSEQSRLEQEAKRLAGVMQHAALRARTAGQALAWQKSNRGYRFMVHGDTWIDVPNLDGEILRPRELPEGIEVQLLKSPSSAANNEMPPALVFPASGVAQRFMLRIASASKAYRIEGDANGRIALQSEAGP